MPQSKNTSSRRVRARRCNRGGRRDTQWHDSSMYGFFYHATRAKLWPSENKLRKVWLTRSTFRQTFPSSLSEQLTRLEEVNRLRHCGIYDLVILENILIYFTYIHFLLEALNVERSTFPRCSEKIEQCAHFRDYIFSLHIYLIFRLN